MNDKITAPWADKQITALNVWQQLGYVHEFTCPNGHKGNRELKAFRDCWRCLNCGYTQDWAHDFMKRAKP